MSPIFKSKIAFSKSSSPGHAVEPELSVVISGPPASEASPVVSIIPSVKGKLRPFPEKYPMPFVEPKSVPVEEITFEISAQEVSIKISSTSSLTVYVV